MKNEKSKTKSEDTELYTITAELQAGHRATFTYTNFELADAHYTTLQSKPVIGQFGIKSIQRSWRK